MHLGEKNANIKIGAPCWLGLVISFMEFMSEDLKTTSDLDDWFSILPKGFNNTSSCND